MGEKKESKATLYVGCPECGKHVKLEVTIAAESHEPAAPAQPVGTDKVEVTPTEKKPEKKVEETSAAAPVAEPKAKEAA